MCVKNGFCLSIQAGKAKPVISATLTGKVEDHKVEFKVKADLGAIKEQTFEADDLPLHRLAAKAQIKELQDNESKSAINLSLKLNRAHIH